MKKAKRRSISMRDGEYIALRMYKEELNLTHGEDVYAMASTLKCILFGELPPIPKRLLDIGKEEAKKAMEERIKHPPKSRDPGEHRPGGEIFTF